MLCWGVVTDEEAAEALVDEKRGDGATLDDDDDEEEDCGRTTCNWLMAVVLADVAEEEEVAGLLPGDSRRAFDAASAAELAPVLPTVTAADDMGKAGEGGRRMYLMDDGREKMELDC